jgi:hypothetical protein
LKKGNDSLAASIPTLPGGALKGSGKKKDLQKDQNLNKGEVERVGYG